MKIKNALVLAGGMGTRLRSVVNDVPKPMAPVAGKPFVAHLLDWLYNYEFEHVCFSIGYLGDVVKEYFKHEYRGMKISYVVEKEPLGTGGGIKLASSVFENEYFFVFNGDTMFHADLWEMEKSLFTTGAELVIGLKPMKDFDRYGNVSIDKTGRITAFEEKRPKKEGLINGGVYLMSSALFDLLELSGKFSFEKDVMEKSVNDCLFQGVPSVGYFIDIGIPEDYLLAQEDFSKIPREKLIQRIRQEDNWTLFLDRDGVINKRIKGNYVRYPDEFEFIEGSDKAVGTFRKCFERIILVTNQQGVGKSLMAAEMIDKVHAFMEEGTKEYGGNFDAMYYCPELAKLNPKGRKPNIGMALQALEEFPETDFEKSIIVGDSISDIRFGKRVGMISVFVDTKSEAEIEASYKEDIDFRFDDLASFAAWFE